MKPDSTPAGTFARHALPLALAMISVAIMIGGRQLGMWLRYDRVRTLEYSEVWRLLTAHVVHLGWNHLLMNLAGLGLIWLLFNRAYGLSQWVVVALFSMLGVSVGLVLMPTVQWYVGMSGMLHGLFVAGALASLAAGYRAELLLLGLLAAKLGWEQTHGALPGSASLAGGDVLVESHLFGAIAGLIIAVLLLVFDRLRRPGAMADAGSPRDGKS